MIREEDIREAAARLREAAPNSMAILFGSHARGRAREASDLDVLVVEPEVKARRREMTRLKDAVRSMGLPMDIVVVSRKTFNDWAGIPGTLIHEAAREGRVLYEPA